MKSANNHESEEQIEPIVIPAYENKETQKVSLFNKINKNIVRKKKNNTNKPVEKKKKVLSKTPAILPFLKIDENAIFMKEGVMDILQIETKDLHSLNKDEMEFFLYSDSGFLRSYYPSIKMVALNFPVNNTRQLNYWKKKQGETEDPLKLRFIKRKIFELQFLEKERTNREFFLFIYAKNVQQLEERRSLAIRNKKQSFPVKTLSIQKKEDILFILNNQNSKL